jgi:hypothetical protein
MPALDLQKHMSRQRICSGLDKHIIFDLSNPLQEVIPAAGFFYAR